MWLPIPAAPSSLSEVTLGDVMPVGLLYPNGPLQPRNLESAPAGSEKHESLLTCRHRLQIVLTYCHRM